MGKMKLDLDALVVESFVTTGYSGWMGTVRGQGASENPCASELDSCNCTMNFAVEGCGSIDQPCGGIAGTQTCAEGGANTCGYGCTLGYNCSAYCGGTNAGTCAENTCYSACGGDTCGCINVSMIGTCAYQDSCGGATCDDAICLGHSGGWCTRRCGGTVGMPDGQTCDANCVGHSDGASCVGCTGGISADNQC
jgi:hypothetical protein